MGKKSKHKRHHLSAPAEAIVVLPPENLLPRLNKAVQDEAIARLAPVQNGEVIKSGINPDASVKCDRCGRSFLVKFKFCVCRG